MNRLIPITLTGVAALAVAACGSAAAGATTSPSPSSAGRGGFVRNGAAGQLVQINGTTLILSNANGDTTVTYTTSTSITQTSTGVVADITPGTCITATGQKDSTGLLDASTVSVSDPVNGSCAAFGGAGFGRPGGVPPSPRPSFSPPAGAGRFNAVRGIVTAVSGTSVTVRQTSAAATSATTTITIPTTVRVTRSSPVAASALQTGECLTAVGSKSSTGTVSARALVIVPAGPSGCFTGRGSGGIFGGGSAPVSAA